MNNNTTSPDSRDAIVMACTLFTVLCVIWVVLVNSVTLFVVYGVTMERHKKQIISLLVADMYNGFIGLPISVLHFNDLGAFKSRLVCLLSFGIADLGAMMLVTSCATLCLTTFLTLRFPFRGLTFRNWETRICVTQWALPVIYMITLCIFLLLEAEGSSDSCDWAQLPKWYFYTFGATMFPILTLAFVSACGVLCIARQQAVAIDAMQTSRNSALTVHSQDRNIKQRRLAKLILIAFFLTWVPVTIIISLVIFSSSISLDDELFFMLYISILSIAASMPVFFCYTFKGVKSRLNILVERVNVCR